MSIVLSNVSFTHHGRPLFWDVNFELHDRERVALLGHNGTGKTTLLRLISGALSPTTGHVTCRGTVAYLPQVAALPDVSILAAVQPAPLVVARNDLRRAEANLARPTPAHLEQYALAEEAFRLLGGYDVEQRAREVLTDLQLDPDQPTGTLSGGQRRRALLAQLRLVPADVYLLDEPTNHLDWPTLEWLEGWVDVSPSAFLIVSHDRAFLDATVSRCVELDRGALREYPGSYTDAMAVKATLHAARERQFAAYERKVQSLAQEMTDVKQRAASTDRYNPKRKKPGNKKYAKNNAQDVARTLARRAQALARRLDRMEAPERLPLERRRLHLALTSAAHSPAEVLVLDEVRASREGRLVLNDVSLHVRRGEKVAVVGPNGAGKSTLLDVAVRRLEPGAGIVRHGPLRIHWSGQHAEELERHATQRDALLASCPSLSSAELYGTLAKLDLPREPEHAVSALSGGQRTRLSLACLSLTGAGLLVLDEPTNHLDVSAIEVLEDVLCAYPGTVVFASHDRHLVSRVATRCWWVEDGRVLDLGDALPE